MDQAASPRGNAGRGLKPRLPNNQTHPENASPRGNAGRGLKQPAACLFRWQTAASPRGNAGRGLKPLAGRLVDGVVSTHRPVATRGVDRNASEELRADKCGGASPRGNAGRGLKPATLSRMKLLLMRATLAGILAVVAAAPAIAGAPRVAVDVGHIASRPAGDERPWACRVRVQPRPRPRSRRRVERSRGGGDACQ